MLALAQGSQSDRAQLAKKLKLCSIPDNAYDAISVWKEEEEIQR
jgi:hypothetical protein